MEIAGAKALELLIAALIAANMPPGLTEKKEKQAQAKAQESIKVIASSEVRHGEGCMRAFARIGHPISPTQCLASAKKAGITPLWHQDANGKTTIIIPLQAGDPFAVAMVNGEMRYLLYNNKK